MSHLVLVRLVTILKGYGWTEKDIVKLIDSLIR